MFNNYGRWGNEAAVFYLIPVVREGRQALPVGLLPS